MLNKLIGGIKRLFSSDPSDMEPEELVALVANRQTPEAQRRAGVEAMSEMSDVVGELDEDDKGPVSNRAYSTLVELLGRHDEPAWITTGAIRGMNEIVNVGRYDMDAALIEASVDPLIARLDPSCAPETRGAACGALSSIDEVVSEDAARRSIEAVAQVMRQDSGELRSDAVFSLGSFDSERTASLWAEVATYLDDPAKEVRTSAASALWMIGNEEPDPQVIERLAAMLDSEQDPRLLSSVVDSLGNLGKGHPATVPALTKALVGEATRHMAIFALSEFGEDAEPAVAKLAVLLDDEEHGDSAVMALQEIGTESARAALRAAGHPEQG